MGCDAWGHSFTHLLTEATSPVKTLVLHSVKIFWERGLLLELPTDFWSWMYQRFPTINITDQKIHPVLQSSKPRDFRRDERTEQDWVFSLGWESCTHPKNDNRATLNVQIPKNPCRGVLLTGVTLTTRYCYPTKGLMARKSCLFAGGLSFFIEQIPWKFTVPAIDHLFLFPPVPTFEVFKTDQRTSPEPWGPTEMLKAEPWVWSVPNVAPQWNQFRKEGMAQFNLICLTLSTSTHKILLLTFPGGFQPEMRVLGHTAPHFRTIFAAGKSSRRPQILREDCLSSAHKILSSLWTFYTEILIRI